MLVSFTAADEEVEDIDETRSFVAVTNNYDVELSPEFKGKSKLVKIAHQLGPNETDRFHLTIDHDFRDPALVYAWYYLKITIMYDGQTHTIESMPLLLSVPVLATWAIRSYIKEAEQDYSHAL